MYSLVFFLLLSPASDAFRCEPTPTRPFSLVVSEAPPLYPYTLLTSAGSPFLEGGSYAVHSDGAWYAAGGALIPGAPSSGGGSEGALGPFTYLSIPWAASNASVAFTATFKCFSSGALVFDLLFPSGLSSAATLPPPVNNSSGWKLPSNALPCVCIACTRCRFFLTPHPSATFFSLPFAAPRTFPHFPRPWAPR